MGLSTDTTPARHEPDGKRRFATALTPCLALVAPAGMDQGERRAWLDAAFTALNHLPIELIEKGALEARRTADHPSKIVPAIIAATEGELSWRRRNSQPPATPEPALPAPGDERPNSNEIDEICKRFSVGRYAKEQPRADPSRPVQVTTHADPDRTCRKPTRADYLRLGVAAETLDSMGITA